jgi:hypothetical protein
MGTEAIAEKLSETVAVLGIIAGETNSAVDPVAITDKNLSIWESEALSHFRRSAWEGKFLTALLDLFLSAHVVHRSRQPLANGVSLYDHH